MISEIEGEMPKLCESVELMKGMQSIWIIWSAMLSSLLIYVIICFVMVDKIRIDIGPIASFRYFKIFLYIIAGVELFLIHYLRKVFLKVHIDRQGPTTAKQTPAITYRLVLKRYTIATVISLALADSIAIYGVVLFFLAKDYYSLYALIGVSAIVMFIYRPKLEEIEKLGKEIEYARR